MNQQGNNTHRYSGYGPMGRSINMMQTHPCSNSSFPPPPPPIFANPPTSPPPPCPPPGLFDSPHTHPGTALSTVHQPSPPPPIFQTTPTPTQQTQHNTTPPDALSHPLPPVPTEFCQSPTHWDTRSVFGLDLPRTIRQTAHTTSNKTAGVPVTQLPLLACVRHTWNSYWIRYLAHGNNLHMVFTKNIAEAACVSEFLAKVRSRKLDIDKTAMAYCHQHSIPAHTRQAAITALVNEFIDYMCDVNPTSTSKSAALNTSTQADPASAHRIAELEHQLAISSQTIQQLQQGNQAEPFRTPTKPKTTQHATGAPHTSDSKRSNPPGSAGLRSNVAGSPSPSPSQPSMLRRGAFLFASLRSSRPSHCCECSQL